MSRPAAALAQAVVMAAALLAVVAAPAAADSLSSADQAVLYQHVLDGLLIWSDAELQNKSLSSVRPSTGLATAGAGSPLPKGATGSAVAKAISDLLVTASIQEEAQSSLGAPKMWSYSDGSGRHALYRLPKSGSIKGTCIFIHGCKHDPESWFYKSTACPKCTGLPEEVSHSKQCLARGYAVLALMSKNRDYRNRCFSSSSDGSSDQPSAKDVIVSWTKAHDLHNKPKYMFGVSSGASFAIKYPKTQWIDGIVSEVNMPSEDAWGATDLSTHKFKVKYPPTAFYMMARDPETEDQIKAAIKIFKYNKVPADYIYIPVVKVKPAFFSDRSVYMSKVASAQLAKALRRIGVLDENGWIRYDVRKDRRWMARLYNQLSWLKRESTYFNLVSDESQIWQELNLAFSKHEITSDNVRATLAWLESKGKKDLNALANMYDLNGVISCLTENKEGCRRRSRAMRL